MRLDRRVRRRGRTTECVSEIGDIGLGELRSLRRIAVRNFAIRVAPSAPGRTNHPGHADVDYLPPRSPRRWYLRGGDVTQNDGEWCSRFNQVLREHLPGSSH